MVEYILELIAQSDALVARQALMDQVRSIMMDMEREVNGPVFKHFGTMALMLEAA